jgi:CubicO group peptidase (beta-lactamase class C family)
MKCRIRTLICLAVALTLVTSSLVARTKAEEIDAVIQKYFEYGQFNGSALIAERGQIILKKGYGFANFEWEIPNDPTTKFRLASITKQFTAMLIMQQVEKGTIGLDDPIGKYISDYPKPAADKITVRRLLTHTSGLFNYTDLRDSRVDRTPRTVDEIIALFSTRPLEFEPGSKMKYSNSGYVLLGAMLEKVTGKPYERLLRDDILEPLGMKNTGYDHSETILKKRAAGYGRRVTLENASYIDMSLPYSAGAMYSTVEDLYLWDQALYSDKLLSPASKKVYFAPFLRNYAFGWDVRNSAIGATTDSVMVLSHQGGINGFNTIIARLPEQRHLIVLLNNTGEARLMEMSRAIIGILFNKPYDEPRQALATVLGKIIDEQGLSAGLAQFPTMKEEKSRFYLSEQDLNRLGHFYLQAGKVKEAIEIFKLNVEAFPNSSNVYDSLGEGYMADGQTGLAIVNYEKSVQLNPNNTGGIQALKKLRATKTER